MYLHQHAPEMANNAREWRHVLAHTEAANLSLCLDVHWILRGGQDVMTLVRECGPRIGSLHLRNSVGGVWTEALGDGDVDYPAVAAYLRSIHYRGYISVELGWDPKTQLTRSLEEDSRLSREYTEKVFLGK
jgi:inosose dehydratase